MKKRRLKEEVIPYLIGGSSILVVCLGIGLASSIDYYKPVDNYDYVSETILDESVPVVSIDATYLKPFTDGEVSIITDYYDYDGENTNQENSLIYTEGTYLQNTGVIYGKDSTFDVVSVLDGKVIDVKTDTLLGTIVHIEHANNIISIYSSLSETSLKTGDMVLRGQVIGSSGVSNLNPSIGNHLLFELIIDGVSVDPENYYGKTLN